MNLEGKITGYDGRMLTISCPFSDTDFLATRRIIDCAVILEDGRTITQQQRKYIYAILRDISFHTGHEPEFLKDYFKIDTIARTGGNFFSLHDCSMTEANDLIDTLIQFCVEWEIPTKDSLTDLTPSIEKYIYWCLKNKVCCVTRRSGAELHHVDHVGMGRDRKEIAHIGMRAMPLLRSLHNEAHYIGQKEFDQKHHVMGIPLTPELCEIWELNKEGDKRAP